jgi:hypothetical protein
MNILDPRWDYPAKATADECSALVLDEAIGALVVLRAPGLVGDNLAELHAMTSLVAEVNARVPQVVADAKDQGHSWSDIAGQLGTGTVRTLLRHAGRTRSRRTPLTPD